MEVHVVVSYVVTAVLWGLAASIFREEIEAG
jgi:hypothetical protein